MSGSALQTALYSALTVANVASGRIYDRPPQSVTFPYVEIGESQAIPDDVSTTTAEPGDDGVAETLDLHVWSREAGQKEAKDIAAAIKFALHGQSLAVDGRASALAWVRSIRMLRDPDGKTTHGVVTVEIVHRNTP